MPPRSRPTSTTSSRWVPSRCWARRTWRTTSSRRWSTPARSRSTSRRRPHSSCRPPPPSPLACSRRRISRCPPRIAAPASWWDPGPLCWTASRPTMRSCCPSEPATDGRPSIAKHSGDAYLDKIDIKIIPEASVRTGSLQSNQVQGIQDLQPTDEAQFDGNGFFLLVRSNPGIVTSLIPNQARSDHQGSEGQGRPAEGHQPAGDHRHPVQPELQGRYQHPRLYHAGLRRPVQRPGPSMPMARRSCWTRMAGPSAPTGSGSRTARS